VSAPIAEHHPARESPQITVPATTVQRSGRGELFISGAIVVFGRGWQPTDRRRMSSAHARVVAAQAGEPQLVNRVSGWLAFTVSKQGWTDVHTVSPDGRELHYVISVTDTGTKTLTPAAPAA
jgi:hypothetical protein